MSNRTNRTLSANTLGLNLGTRSLAIQAGVTNDMNETLRLRLAHASHPGAFARSGRAAGDFAITMPAFDPAMPDPKREPVDAKSPRLPFASSSGSSWPATPDTSRGYGEPTQGQVVVTGVSPSQPAEPLAERPRRLDRATTALDPAVAC